MYKILLEDGTSRLLLEDGSSFALLESMSESGAAAPFPHIGLLLQAPVSPTYVYIGPSSRSTRYLGAKTDAEIYLGVNDLFP